MSVLYFLLFVFALGCNNNTFDIHTNNWANTQTNAVKKTTTAKCLNGFMENCWGTSKLNVLRNMARKKDAVKEMEKSDLLIYKGGCFADRKVDKWIFGFIDDKFFQVTIQFDIAANNVISGAVNSPIGDPLINNITQKYGEPSELSSTSSYNYRNIYWHFSNASIHLLYNKKNQEPYTVKTKYLYELSYYDSKLSEKRHARVLNEKMKVLNEL